MSKTAIILGATGLTGSILLKMLIEDTRYHKIKLFSRKGCGITHPKIEEHLIDMLQLRDQAEKFTADEVFCCIGTTNAKTPNKELYHQIDYGIPVSAARLCKTNTINTLIIVSALGADSESRIFYNRTKGEMEKAVLEFDISKTHILQPSLIAGKRNEKRFGEYFFKIVMKIMNSLFLGPLKKYRSIHPETIVSAMIWLANHEFNEQKIVSDKIKALAIS
ncbi:NAD-dependent epimerase/dehydratase family protein [Aquimarina sp. AD10]|uniref:NAD-dependent epimerase/dehydratase family protein n=1 Tax=Aquimarina sp. AD10 TaxID=1714849 RepID=UPI000E55043B|nr:NAD-dependent epimerase/dehydratase family protein [Aquimarina sp. AD10]AXT61504.1 NAD-dependent epimerase/dehydratase family protein [Aquimarina sp. AD10]RKM89988.1 NAD-dependent epimerase/dehydratase family protein [Aquimarina sp. AD10]